ncbi:unnamed protein product [american hop latent virus]|uniref:Capsid protein n=1 Tax=american hop latent virus TaxID=3158378 RepID=I1W5T6_9VIRU|nr:unnamed protein product [American hop latent virus]AFI61523.1 capsid protein [American hop latent virus]
MSNVERKTEVPPTPSREPRIKDHQDVVPPAPASSGAKTPGNDLPNAPRHVVTPSPAQILAAEEVKRLDELLDSVRSERMSVIVKNMSYEKGRPRLRPLAEMTPDLTNPYAMLSLEHLIALPPEANSTNMATSEHIALIFSDIEGAGVPTEHVTRVIIQMVLYYANTSSSRYMDPDGSISFGTGAIPRDSLHAIFNKRSTARKVSRLYAPIVWNYMLLHNTPPSDWQAMGFRYEERFAAFDTFDYILNPAAIQPVEGLIRHPTSAECIAHKTHQRLALDRNAQERLSGVTTPRLLGECEVLQLRGSFDKRTDERSSSSYSVSGF